MEKTSTSLTTKQVKNTQQNNNVVQFLISKQLPKTTIIKGNSIIKNNKK